MKSPGSATVLKGLESKGMCGPCTDCVSCRLGGLVLGEGDSSQIPGLSQRILCLKEAGIGMECPEENWVS